VRNVAVVVSWSGDLPTSWTALAADPLTASVELVAPAGNGAAVQVRVGGGATQSIAPGVSWSHNRIDLSTVEVQGSEAGLSLTVGGEAPGA
jgi:microcystin degradation protein MlrC